MDRTVSHRLAWLALFFAVLAIIIFRAPEMVFWPSLLFDEGAKVFAHFYEHREPAQILRFKSGYLPLIGNLIGYVVVRLPPKLMPYGFVGSAVAITAATYSLFFARSFRRWMPSDVDRALVCLILALAPISDCLLVTMSDYSLWNLLAALILLAAAPPAKRAGWRYAHAFICNLLIWSHPLAIVITPLVLWRVFKDRENRTFYRVLLFNLVVHQVFGVSGIVTSHGLWDHGTGVQIGVSLGTKLFDSIRWTIQIVAASCFRTAFGEPFYDRIRSSHPALLYLWTMGIAAASCLASWKIARIRGLVAFIAYLVLSLTFLSCFLRYEDVHGDPLGFISYSPRYIYLQSLAWLVLFGALLSCAWELGATRRFTFVPLFALLCYYYVQNLQQGYTLLGQSTPGGRYYDTNPQNGVIVREFFDKLAEAEQARGSHRGIQLTATKINDWPIVIDTTATPPPMSLRMSKRARVLAITLGLIALSYISRRWWRPWVARSRQGPQRSQ